MHMAGEASCMSCDLTVHHTEKGGQLSHWIPRNKSHIIFPNRLSSNIPTHFSFRFVCMCVCMYHETKESYSTYFNLIHGKGTWRQRMHTAAAATAKSLQSCLTLCDPIDGSPPGSPVPGIFKARTLEWVAISFSNAGKWKVKVKSLSRVRLFATPWTAACQAPPSLGFSRQEYWSGVPLPSPDAC